MFDFKVGASPEIVGGRLTVSERISTTAVILRPTVPPDLSTAPYRPPSPSHYPPHLFQDLRLTVTKSIHKYLATWKYSRPSVTFVLAYGRLPNFALQ